MVLYGIILLERFLGVVGVKASRVYSLTVKHYLCHILYRNALQKSASRLKLNTDKTELVWT